MHLLVLGKIGGITHWTEDCVASLRAAGHDVHLSVTRNPRLHPAIERTLDAAWAGALRPASIARTIQRRRATLILAINAYAIPLPILHRVAALPGRPPLIAWVGDLMHDIDRTAANLFDLAAYTDTGLVQRHQALGFRCPAMWLPHAASPRITMHPATARNDRMSFVATPTPGRQALIEQVRSPLCLYGRGWSKVPHAAHHVEDRRIGPKELSSIYRTHFAVLNIRHEGNVLTGLNQRHFDAGAAGAVVVSDDQPDLPGCFEPEREILVYRDAAELNGLYDRLRREPGYAAKLGAAACRRVMADHTYGQRLKVLVKSV